MSDVGVPAMEKAMAVAGPADCAPRSAVQAALANVCWRTKILAFAGIFSLGIVIVGVLGGGAIYHLNSVVATAVTDAEREAEAATRARVALLAMDGAQARLIAASAPEDIRAAAVASIKAASNLDEQLLALSENLKNNAQVSELVRLAEEIKPVRVEIIQAARRNEDAVALERAKTIADKIARLESLSQQVFDDQRLRLGAALETARQVGRGALWAIAAFATLGVAFGVTVGCFAARLLVTPLRKLQHAIGVLASGDLRRTVQPQGTDEVETTLASLASTVVSLRSMIQSVQRDSLALYDGASAVTRSAGIVSGNEQQVAATADRIKAGADAAIASATESSKRLAGAVERLQGAAGSATHQDNAREVAGVVEAFGAFESELRAAVARTEDLDRSVRSISSIATTIHSISGQTNLLALNAAIEAARSGEHGRGFAVVAEEVRKLAERTGAATVEIGRLVETIAQGVEQTMASLQRSSGRTVEQTARLRSVLSIWDSTALDAADALAKIEAAAATITGQIEAIATIGSQLGALNATAAGNQLQAAALRDVSAAIDSSAHSLKGLVERFKL